MLCGPRVLYRVYLDSLSSVHVDRWQLYDGLGRATCVVTAQEHGGRSSTLVEYDGCGRPARIWEPIPVSGDQDFSYGRSFSAASASYHGDGMAYTTLRYADAVGSDTPRYGGSLSRWEWRAAGGTGHREIRYNLLNLPSSISYSNGGSACYTYGADGVKRRADYRTPSLWPQIQRPRSLIASGGPFIPMPTEVHTWTEWSENVEYCCDTLSRLTFDGGYVTFSRTTAGKRVPLYHYYVCDHQGNVRVVVDASGRVEQTTHYYPYGVLMGESVSPDAQPRKYGGKPLDRTHGLDWYDYGARWYDAVLCRWTTVDPLAEKTPHVSPYAAFLCDPIRYVDPDGRDPGDTLSSVVQAAVDFGMYYNACSIRDNKEYASTIYKVSYADGRTGYVYTPANIGTMSDSSPSYPNPYRKIDATIHTHGACSERFSTKYRDNEFSGIRKRNGDLLTQSLRKCVNVECDIGNANERGVLSFLVTPSGMLQEYNPRNGEISVVCSNLPCDPFASTADGILCAPYLTPIKRTANQTFDMIWMY